MVIVRKELIPCLNYLKLMNFRSLKNAKRRVVESVLESVGAADRTVDEEFDLYHQRYTSMMVDMNECKQIAISSLNHTLDSHLSTYVPLTKAAEQTTVP